MNDYTLTDKIKELQNELYMRKRVYPKLVENGKLSQAEADKKRRIIAAILADYQELARSNISDLPLFRLGGIPPD